MIKGEKIVIFKNGKTAEIKYMVVTNSQHEIKIDIIYLMHISGLSEVEKSIQLP